MVIWLVRRAIMVIVSKVFTNDLRIGMEDVMDWKISEFQWVVELW